MRDKMPRRAPFSAPRLRAPPRPPRVRSPSSTEEEFVMVVATADRVRLSTRPDLNARIERLTEANIRHFEENPDEIPARLEELDREWDVERMLETGSASLTLAGLVLGMGSRKWLLLSIGVQGFFLQHALTGWCPPLPVLRRLGVRTMDEIERERRELLAIQRDQGKQDRKQ